MTMKELAPKPSDAILAMVKGIKDARKSNRFFVNMNWYLDYDHANKECIGCAATCTILSLTKHDFNKLLVDEEVAANTMLSNVFNYIKSDVNIDTKDMRRFEEAINNLRCGEVGLLLKYYDIDLLKAKELITNLVEYHMPYGTYPIFACDENNCEIRYDLEELKQNTESFELSDIDDREVELAMMAEGKNNITWDDALEGWHCVALEMRKEGL